MLAEMNMTFVMTATTTKSIKRTSKVKICAYKGMFVATKNSF